MHGRSTSPKRNTSFFLRLHAWTIHESNPEQHLIVKAEGTDHVTSGPMRGQTKMHGEWTSERQTDKQKNTQADMSTL